MCKKFRMQKIAAFLLLGVLIWSTMPSGSASSEEKIQTNGPKVALTFDDGPSKANTAKILDVLEVNGARATFFVVGQNVAENASLVRRAVEMGCEIGNHTFDHVKLTGCSAEKIRLQLQNTDRAILRAAGVRPNLVRAPCGRCSPSDLSCVDRPVILWSVDPRDWSYGSRRTANTAENRETVIRAATENVQDGDIILLHDLYAFTAQCCEKIVPLLQQKGFELVTVSELMRAKGITPKAGETYRHAR